MPPGLIVVGLSFFKRKLHRGWKGPTLRQSPSVTHVSLRGRVTIGIVTADPIVLGWKQ